MIKDDLIARLEGRFCLECGNPFTKHRSSSAARWQAQRFCSQGCAGRHANKQKIKSPDEMLVDIAAKSIETASGCREFQGALNQYGYAKMSWRGELWAGHRLVWLPVKGSLPTGAHVLHKCDNRRCVNVEHLFLGDNAANVADRNAKGRQARGERGGRAKLSDESAAAIHASTLPNNQLAQMYGVAENTISQIKTGKRRI